MTAFVLVCVHKAGLNFIAGVSREIIEIPKAVRAIMTAFVLVCVHKAGLNFIAGVSREK